jgi:RNA polymerase sigma-70 factor (ECF subfamily)
MTAHAVDEAAYAELVERHSRELHAHCYRMLGSLHDADDALQDALLRAWRGLPRFQGRSSLRTWLYKIATNACLDHLAGRARRALPSDHCASADPDLGPGEPLVETTWVEPYPDEVDDGRAAPDARYELRESIELAFIAALQHLPASQRAVLILREVLGFSAAEVADQLDTTVASVNSSLQRARRTVDGKLPAQTQQAALAALGDHELAAIVERYVAAWERGDVNTVVSMLTEDAVHTMPPLASWYRGRVYIARFLRGWPLSGSWRWRHVTGAHANGQPAIGCYAYDEGADALLPFCLEVLSFDGREIAALDCFVTRSIRTDERERFANWPEQPLEHARALADFTRFGLPPQLPAGRAGYP